MRQILRVRNGRIFEELEADNENESIVDFISEQRHAMNV